MTVDNEDIRNFTPAQIKKRLKERGGLQLTSDTDTNIIIKEYRNRELDTDDLYTITNDLLDEGVEVVALIIDYLKRIRPAEKGKDEKEELKNITNELKEFAKYWDCAVISAQQLNRSGASIIDSAIRDKKQDVTQLVGRENIGSAWEIQENADWTCIINPEIKIDTGEMFLTFKLLKRRYRSIEPNEELRRKDYFNHPFEPGNGIMLIDDVHMPKSISIDKLADGVSMESILSVEEKKKKLKDKSDITVGSLTTIDDFSMDTIRNY